MVWELGNYQYLAQGQSWDSIHPSLQRQAELNLEHGLFKVRDGIYQVSRTDFTRLLMKQATMQELIKQGAAKVQGDVAVFGRLTSYLDDFDPYFPMALPVDHSAYSYGKSKAGVSPINR